MKTTIVILLFLIIPQVLSAQNTSEDCTPSMSDAGHFCGYVRSKYPYRGVDGNFEYVFQEVMYKAACIDIETMSEKEIGERLRKWWDLYKDKLLCDSMEFNVTYGSVFKYAINGGVTAFIDEAIYYKLDLNFVDKSDNRTILDYTRDELKKHNEKSAIRKTLQEYYTKLRKAGAKHRSEL